MIALLDIGNTRTKFAFFLQEKEIDIQSVSNEEINNEFLESNFIHATKAIVASVSNDCITDTINAWCVNNKVKYQSVTTEKSKGKLINAYQEPETLGIDRWLALLGAVNLFPKQNVLIVDAGTATTFDLLAANGQHKGGWILAGIDMLIKSLLQNTAQLTAKDKEEVSFGFGESTSANIHNAAWGATVGALNLAIEQSKQNGLILDKVVLTGGNGKLLSSLLDIENLVVDDLIFIGLKAYI